MPVALDGAIARGRRRRALGALRWPPELFVLAALGFGLVAAPIVRGDLISHEGIVHYYALLSFVARQVRAAAWPSWNPFMVSGYPEIADPTTMFFYPATVPALMIFSVRDAVNTIIVLQLVLAGWFMYLYLGTIPLSRPARFLGGAVYMLSGFAAERVFAGDPQRLGTYALIPLLFYLVEEIVQARQRAGGALLGGLVLACQFFAGDPQTFAYATLALLAYAVCRLVNRRRGHGGPGAGLPATDIVGPALLLAAMLGFAACFAAAQALPTWQLFMLSNRRGLPPGFALLGSVPPLGLVSFLAPHFFGDEVRGSWGEIVLRAHDFYPHASTFYVGFFTLALIIIALLGRRDRWHVRFFGALGVAVLWLALGRFGILYRAVMYVPLLKSFRDIENINILLPISASVLAGFGLDGYRDGTSTRETWSKTRTILFFVLVAAAILWSLTLGWTWYAHRSWLLALREVRGDAGASLLFVGVAFSLSAGLLGLRARYAVNPPAWLAGAATAFIVVDLLCAGLPVTTAGTDIRAVLGEDAITRFLARDRSLYRERGLFDRAVVFGAQDVEGDPGLLPARYSEYTNFLQGYGLDTMVRPGGIHGVLIHRGLGSSLMSLLNVKYVFLPLSGADAARFRRVPGITELAPGTLLYTMPKVEPRILDSYGYVVLHDRIGILRELSRAGYDPRRELVLEETPAVPSGALPAPDAPIQPADLRISSYEADRVTVAAAFVHPGFLLLNDLEYPGWEAFVDGGATPIYRANYLFRAVAVPAGRHEVRFIYRDRHMEWGLRLGAIAGVIGIFAWLLDRRIRHETPVSAARHG